MARSQELKKQFLIELLTSKYTEYNPKDLFSMVMCGEVKVNGETIRDPRSKINPESEIILSSRKWVSRGGEKLNYALLEWNISADRKTVLDAGASTGGFTDCLLQNGAEMVHAVDVGYNQLDYSLRKDPRVNVLERTNIMSVSNLDPIPDFAVADLSFRSITGAASHILGITTENLLIALIKPQFEIPKNDEFDGIIRDTELLYEVLYSTTLKLEAEGVKLIAVLESPIKGGKGNTEFLFQLKIAPEREELNNLAVLRRFLS